MGTRLCCFHAATKRKSKYLKEDTGSAGGDSYPASKNLRVFSYKELRSATSNFHRTNRIGRGGFGVVYKGILRDGSSVAIKSLSTESKQGTKEFLTEIDIVSNVRHPNLVRLLGCCVEGNNRMLVYEYVENNSLTNALLGPKDMRIPLDWPKRAAICLGTARGLSFLHDEAEPRIVHRDIKASNVLLDRDFVPKIGDFGLAKLFPDNVTHISTRVAGTMSYLAPEYALLGQLTRKADVYSYGVLILEIISGRSSGRSSWALDTEDLLEWVWKLRLEDRLLDIVDPELEGYPEEEVLRFIKVGLVCTQAISPRRPSMKEVIEMLLSDELMTGIDVKDLSQPGIVKKSVEPSSSSGNSTAYKDDQGSNTTYAFMASAKDDAHSSVMSMTEMQPR